jgi:endophilin-A
MMAMKSVFKLRGNHNQALYPQPEGQLGECMLKYGRDLGDSSILGSPSVV